MQFGRVDPIRELGLDLEMNRFATRLEALSDPKAYATKRETAFTEMIGHVRKSYDDAYKGFLGAGMSTDMSKGFALQAANNEKLTRRQVIETQFPTNANMIGEMASIKVNPDSVINFAGGQGARRAAPRRRAPRSETRPRETPALAGGQPPYLRSRRTWKVHNSVLSFFASVVIATQARCHDEHQNAHPHSGEASSWGPMI